MDEQFEAALSFVKAGEGPELGQDALLKFYALFKQAREGPCTSEAPSRFNVVAYEKWKACKALGDMEKTAAMGKYIEELTKVSPGWSNVSSEENPPAMDQLEGASSGIFIRFSFMLALQVRICQKSSMLH